MSYSGAGLVAVGCGAVGWYAQDRAADRIARTAGAGLDLVGFWEEVRPAIESVVPFHLTPCWFTLDPASLLATSHYDHGMIPVLPHGFLACEYAEDGYHKMDEVARSPEGISTLHDATGGDPSRSPYWQEFIAPLGGDQQLLLALRTETGQNWGVLALYRAPGEPLFAEDERAFLRRVATPLADGARRGLLVGEATDPDAAQAPGLIVLGEGWEIESITPGTEAWLAELPGAWQDRRVLPASVLSVAGRARAAAERGQPSEVAFARVQSRAGRWVALHGATLNAGNSRRVAVIVEPAHPARISSLLMAAYGLTDREHEVTRLVLRGESTIAIARTLVISTHTVQQHLRNIFEKTGVRSRRDLVGKVFFSHYEPRVRDNEARAGDGRVLRGGPMDG